MDVWIFQILKKKSVELDRELHTIMELVRKSKKHDSDVIESASGAWEYDVDSKEFVRELRRSRRIE